MALSDNIKNFTAGSIGVADSGGTNSLTADTDTGSFSVGELQAVLNEVHPYFRRGRFKSAAYGERIVPAGTFEAMVAQFTDATADVVQDLILQRNKYSAAVSTLGSAAKTPYALDLTFNMEGTDYGDSVDHSFTMHDCIVKVSEFSEGDPNMIKFSFVCLGEITGDLAIDELAA